MPCGDAALSVEFGTIIDRSLSEQVLTLDARLRAAALPGLIETVPTFRSLLITYDPLTLAPANLREAVEAALRDETDEPRRARRFEIPACYEPAHAPDLEEVAERTGLDPDEVVRTHAAIEYHVYMLGFLPGYPYMGDLPDALSLPRRAEPRVRVPAGSVAIATTMTAIYPVESPGGWHLIGRSPVRLFEPGREPPATLAPGDKVKFVPVSGEELEAIAAQVHAGIWSPACEELTS